MEILKIEDIHYTLFKVRHFRNQEQSHYSKNLNIFPFLHFWISGFLDFPSQMRMCVGLEKETLTLRDGIRL